MTGAATYTVDQLAELSGISAWAWRQAVARGDAPIAPIRVGRRMVWPRTAVDAMFGVASENDEARGTTPGHPSQPLLTGTVKNRHHSYLDKRGRRAT